MHDVSTQLATDPWSTLALLGLIATASVLTLNTDRRVLLLGLLSQYVLVGLALIQIGLVQVAGAKVFIGLLVCLILYITIRAAVQGPLLQPLMREDRLFRGLGLTVVALAAYSIGGFTLPFNVPLAAIIAATWLLSAGLLILLFAREPLRIGLGLLTFQTGFEILYATLDEALVVNTLLGVETLLLTLAIAYLIVARVGRPT